jgi:hypothetical protein
MQLERVKENLILDLQTDVVPCVEGETGIGKSDMMHQVAKALKCQMIDVRLGECGESADAFGLPTIIADKDGNKRTVFTKPNWWPSKDLENEPHLLFFDEINRAPDKDTLQTMFKILLKREFHDTKIPDSWKLAAAMNPSKGKYYVQDLDAALEARFIKYKMTCDPQIWLNWAYANNVHRVVTDFISTNPESLHSEGRNNPRTWTMLAKILDVLEDQNKMEYLYDKACGLLDAGTAALFKKFADGNLEKPIPAQKILDSYTDPKAGKAIRMRVKELMSGNKLDVLNATLMEMVTKDVKDENVNNLRAFILDLPPELGYKLMNDFVEKGNQELFKKISKDDQIKKLIASVSYKK